jgi:hypothetical protein
MGQNLATLLAPEGVTVNIVSSYASIKLYKTNGLCRSRQL